MSDTSANNKRIAKNTLFLYFRTFIIMLISLYTSRVVLKALGETDFGIYNLIGGIVVFFGFMNTAMSAATQRYLNYHLGREENDEVRRVFSMSIIIHIMIVFGVMVLGETIGLWFVQTQLNIPPERSFAALWVYQFSLLYCCINIIRIPYNAVIIAYEKMDFYAYLSIIEAVLKLGIIYLLIISPIDSLIFYSALIFGVGVVVFLMYKIYCNRHFSTSKIQWFWDQTLFSKLMSFSGWSLFGSVANVSVDQGISVFFNLLFGVALNAALGLANQIHIAMVSFISSFQTAFSPQIVKYYATKDYDSFHNLIFRSSRLSYCLVFVIAFPLMVCINPILNLWLTDVPDYTASFSVIYIIYCMVDALSGPLWVSVQATGNIKRYQIEISLLILLNLPLVYLVLSCGFSPVYALSVRAGINILAYFYRIIYLTKRISFPGLKYIKQVIVPIGLITVISLPFAIYLSRFTETIALAIIVFAAMALFNLILVFTIGLKRTERAMIKHFLEKKELKNE